jgi:hypothetical protein
MSVMQLSDWLSVISIVLSTLMSLISIAVARHVYRKEAKDQHGFTHWMFKVVKELVGFVLKKVGEILSPRPIKKANVHSDSQKASSGKDNDRLQPGDRQRSQITKPRQLE